MGSNDEHEYEYEYSQTETETFFIDLDLSSVNNVLKSENAGAHRSLKAPRKSAASQKQDDQEGEEEDEEDALGEVENDDGGNAQDGSPSQQQQGVESGGMLDAPADSVQILDLHSHNPIVSYRNQVYSCTWTDMVGTNMFFTKHNEFPIHEPDIATEDYDLIGTSRIKLVGAKATLLARKNAQSGSKKRSRAGQDDEDEDDEIGAEERGGGGAEDNNHITDQTALSNTAGMGSFLPKHYDPNSLRRTNPKTVSDAERQATFLERLKAVKKRRGEKDTVRTFVDRFTTEAAEKKQEEMRKTRKEIERLNRRVVKGDSQALVRLQEIYADMEEVESDEDEDRGAPAAATRPSSSTANSKSAVLPATTDAAAPSSSSASPTPD